MGKGILKVATCQFSVCGSVARNADLICKYMRKARKAKADIVHFPETALSGYVGTDFPTFSWFDWQGLRDETGKIMSLAKELKLWVVLGSVHELTEPNKPCNSLYLISPEGKIVDRYDKRFCIKAELRRYTPGNRFVVFDVNGVKCSLLICFDVRFPEIYRELYKQGVKCVFQSFYILFRDSQSVNLQYSLQKLKNTCSLQNDW